MDRIPILLNGTWNIPQVERWGKVFNPSHGKVIGEVPLCEAEQAREATEAAVKAGREWARVPLVDRARIMFRFHALMDRHFDELAQLVTREHGKTATEARAEVKRGLEMVEFAAGIPSIAVGQYMPNIAEEVDGNTQRFPVGVCVGITPYNFPSMVPLWMFPIAIVCGNSFVLKPSEKVPLSAVRLGELLEEAGLPPGVLNIVHGDKACVDALLTDPNVAAVSFVGSTPIARHVYQTGTAHGKRVQAAGGAKNHLVIMPDADMSLAVKALAASAFGCAGQRCMAGSVAVTVGGVADRLVEKLCQHASQLTVGSTDEDPSREMGPLINPAAISRVEDYLEIATAEGAEIALDGRREFAAEGFFMGPCVVDRVTSRMRIAHEEVFGPVLSIIRVASLEEAIEIGDRCQYGNGASIFTRDGYAARTFQQRFNAGMIGINVGVPAPMAWLPFTGWNQSFFGDLHIQGTEGVDFYTRQKTTLTRWFQSAKDSHVDPVWAGR